MFLKEKEMKKAVFIVTMVLGFAFLFACKSEPKETPPPPSEEPSSSYEDLSAAREAADDAQQRMEEKIEEAYPTRLIIEGARTYTVVRGDTLASIARKMYGDAYY